MTYSANITVNGTTYSYPNGPALPGYLVRVNSNYITFTLSGQSVTPYMHLAPLG